MCLSYKNKNLCPYKRQRSNLCGTTLVVMASHDHSLTCNGADRNDLLMGSVILLRGDIHKRSCPPCTKRRLSMQELECYLSSSTQIDINVNCTDAPSRVCAVSYLFFLRLSRKSSLFPTISELISDHSWSRTANYRSRYGGWGWHPRHRFRQEPLQKRGHAPDHGGCGR